MILFLVGLNLSVAMAAIIIISTYPNKESVLKIANFVVKKHLAACVNFTKINSIYIWGKKLENSSEFLTFFKTTKMKKELLKKEIKKTHPYKVPEIIELETKSVNNSYLNWLTESTS